MLVSGSAVRVCPAATVETLMNYGMGERENEDHKNGNPNEPDKFLAWVANASYCRFRGSHISTCRQHLWQIQTRYADPIVSHAVIDIEAIR